MKDDPRGEERQKEITSALRVDGEHPLLPFDDDLFLLDYWHFNDALLYLIGARSILDEGDSNEANPYGYEEVRENNWIVTTLDYEVYSERDQSHIVDAFREKLKRLTRIWESGRHEKINSPSFYIDWALAKGFEIPWLDYAQRKGFFKSLSGPKKSEFSSANERNTMLRIIAALSVGGYRYPSRGSQAEMLRDFQANGMAIDDKTLSKYLKQAETYLPSKLDSA